MSDDRPSRFEAECRRRQVRFGLADWAFRFKVEEGDETKDCQVDMDHDARTAIFTYFTKGEHVDSPEREAAHEVYHVVLVELEEAAALHGNLDHKIVVREGHRAIERLLNAEEGLL